MLSRQASSYDITSAIAEKSNTSTTYSKRDLDNFLTGKASSSDLTSTTTRKAEKSTRNIKNDVANFLTEKASSSKVNGQHNSVIFRDPAQINPPVQYLSLLGGGNICSGVAVVPPLNLI